MQFNFGAGIAAGAKAAADTYEKSSLEEQKADLENQKIRLADDLAGAREEKMEGIKHGHELERIEKQGAVQLDVATKSARAGEEIKIEFAPKVAAAARQASIDNAASPEFIKSLHIMADANTTPAQRSQIEENNARVFGLKIANAAAQEVEDARKDLQNAKDPDAVDAAQRRMAIATYNAGDEVKAAATQKGLADSARLYAQSVQSELTDANDPKKASTPGGKANIKALEAELEVAKSTYKTLYARAVTAGQNVPDINIGRSSRTHKQPLSLYNSGGLGDTSSAATIPGNITTNIAGSIPGAGR